MRRIDGEVSLREDDELQAFVFESESTAGHDDELWLYRILSQVVKPRCIMSGSKRTQKEAIEHVERILELGETRRESSYSRNLAIDTHGQQCIVSSNDKRRTD